MSSSAEYVGCAHEIFVWSLLPLPNRLFCCCYRHFFWASATTRCCQAGAWLAPDWQPLWAWALHIDSGHAKWLQGEQEKCVTEEQCLCDCECLWVCVNVIVSVWLLVCEFVWLRDGLIVSVCEFVWLLLCEKLWLSLTVSESAVSSIFSSNPDSR